MTEIISTILIISLAVSLCACTKTGAAGSIAGETNATTTEATAETEVPEQTTETQSTEETDSETEGGRIILSESLNDLISLSDNPSDVFSVRIYAFGEDSIEEFYNAFIKPLNLMKIICKAEQSTLKQHRTKHVPAV